MFDPSKPDRIRILRADPQVLVYVFGKSEKFFHAINSGVAKDSTIVFAELNEALDTLDIYLRSEEYELIDPKVKPFPEIPPVIIEQLERTRLEYCIMPN